MGGKKKKKGKCQFTNGERERERVICVRQNVSATMWGTVGAAHQQIS